MISYHRNVTPFIFIILANLVTFIRSQPFCPNNGNYTNNSTYQSNLNTLFSTLSTNIDNNGFYNTSVGQDSDRVNGLALCRGDTQLDFCRSCVQNATSDLVRACPNYRQGIIWSEFCMLRYSNASIYGTMDTSVYGHVWNVENSTNPGELMSDLRTLFEGLRSQASAGDSTRKVAVGNRSTTDFQTLFAMLQCTPDLSSLDCDTCLRTAAQRLPGCCYGLIGARMLLPSCNLRYETRRFYNETRLQELVPSSLVPPEPSPPLSIPSPPPSQPVNEDNNRRNNSTRTIIIIVVSVVAGLIIVVLSGCFIMKMKPKEATADGETVDEISIVESLQYDFGIIKSATNDFSEANKLGQGGFGAVYKGKLPNGQEIAVKRLSIGSGQGDSEFKNEVVLLVKLQHRNLVRLLGFSLEGSEKLLVYEFVQNASLDAFIFDTAKRSLLDWDRRYKIIGGIARGILYLHEDSRLTIIHRDLKASNILLDGNMNPKIADFGMARLYVPDETQGSTSRIVGTYGYMAPEYAMHGQYSVKSDVFSFGVLLLEIISGQKNNCFRHGEIEEDLISSAWENWRQGTAVNLVDPLLRVGSSVPRDILRCIHIGLLCVQENGVDRPTMASVIMMLHSFSITLPVLSAPGFFVQDGNDSASLPQQEFNWSNENSSRPIKNEGAELPSQNEMSISEYQPR